MILTSVDLPAPLSPTSATISPAVHLEVESLDRGHPSEDLPDAGELQRNGGVCRHDSLDSGSWRGDPSAAQMPATRGEAAADARDAGGGAHGSRTPARRKPKTHRVTGARHPPGAPMGTCA